MDAKQLSREKQPDKSQERELEIEIDLLKDVSKGISFKKEELTGEVESLKRQVDFYANEIKSIKHAIAVGKNYLPKKLKKYPITLGQFHEKQIEDLKTERNNQLNEYQMEKTDLVETIKDEERKLKLIQDELAEWERVKEVKFQHEAEILRLEEEGAGRRHECYERLKKLREELEQEKTFSIKKIEEIISRAESYAEQESNMLLLRKWQNYRSENENLRQKSMQLYDNINVLEKQLIMVMEQHANLNYESVFAADFNHLQLTRLSRLKNSKAAVMD